MLRINSTCIIILDLGLGNKNIEHKCRQFDILSLILHAELDAFSEARTIDLILHAELDAFSEARTIDFMSAFAEKLHKSLLLTNL